MGRWVGGWIVWFFGFRMRCCGLGLGGWVGGWRRRGAHEVGEELVAFLLGVDEDEDIAWGGGWVGGWVGSLVLWLSNEVLDAMGRWVGGWVGGWVGELLPFSYHTPSSWRRRMNFSSSSLTSAYWVIASEATDLPPTCREKEGGWVGGWVGRKVEEKRGGLNRWVEEKERLYYMGGWVGGWEDLPGSPRDRRAPYGLDPLLVWGR